MIYLSKSISFEPNGIQCIILSFVQQHTIDEVENLIKRHEAFEKAAAAQEERFVALERLTTVYISLIV